MDPKAKRAGVTRVQRSFSDFELRRKEGADTLTFTGYASVFGVPYVMHDWLGEFTEEVDPEAFDVTLRSKPDVQFLINHEGIALARTLSGTLKLGTDKHGLHVEAELDPRMTPVRDLEVALERRDMDQMSFAFRIIRQEWNEDWDHVILKEVSLDRGDVSVVNQGANPNTNADPLRALDDLLVARSLDVDALRRIHARTGDLIAAAEPKPDGMSIVDALAVWAKTLDT